MPSGASPSFCPENEQIELAWGSFSGAAPIGVGLPLPVTSPANAEPAPKAATATVHAATASIRLIPISYLPWFVTPHRRQPRMGRYAVEACESIVLTYSGPAQMAIRLVGLGDRRGHNPVQVEQLEPAAIDQAANMCRHVWTPRMLLRNKRHLAFSAASRSPRRFARSVSTSPRVRRERHPDVGVPEDRRDLTRSTWKRCVLSSMVQGPTRRRPSWSASTYPNRWRCDTERTPGSASARTVAI